MAPRRGITSINVTEEFRIKTEKTLYSFMEDDTITLDFPKSLTNLERAWVHEKVRLMGLHSKSVGKEPKRCLTVYKNRQKSNPNPKIKLNIQQENLTSIQEFLIKFPLAKDKQNGGVKYRNKEVYIDNNMGQLTHGAPSIPPPAVYNELIPFRMTLPIWYLRDNLIETIVTNQVTIVCGETGSGKTTQLPQYILDYTRSTNGKCRVLCTQPRRISAVSVAERVATERGEKVGHTVGFHIRLESCVGPKTLLIYCTNGILLRTLMNGDQCLDNFTHIIVDEVHERDRFSDFLLICLRECLVNHPHLRLILMSATMDINLFQKYFNNAPLYFVPGRMYPVTEYYLDDILQLLSYESPAMFKEKKHFVKQPTSTPNAFLQALHVEDNSTGNSELDLEMNGCIMECYETGSEEAFSQLMQLILSEHVPTNYQHPDNGLTGLMTAAIHGNEEIAQQLLRFGANPNLVSKDNTTAYTYACENQQSAIVHLLQSFNYCDNKSDICMDISEKQLTDLYLRTVSDSVIDFDLLHMLLLYIHLRNNNYGSILVFLPGYDDISICKERIQYDKKFSMKAHKIFVLHGNMQMTDQSKVFLPLKNSRKIILSTNIAETSVTIDDVIYVVDCGKIKEKSYDAIVGVCTLQSNWVSQACAKQRAGRAGRCQAGVCYHLFSKQRFINMQDFQTPEILRMPLHELCLQTKMLAPRGVAIASFLARCIEPPSSMAVHSAIAHLQEIEALDSKEELTPLGVHLVDLPVEPRLAKMLIYAVIFKCIDPVLTIVSILACRDPFLLPSQSHQRSQAIQMRRTFSTNTFSDHMILLRAFQSWQDAHLNKSERSFCNKYFISSATMEMVVDLRSQLLAQLRACGFVKTRPPSDIRELNSNSNNWAVVKAVLTAGLYPNIAHIVKHPAHLKTKKEKKVLLHHSSALRDSRSAADYTQCLRRLPSTWLIFEELSRAGTIYNVRSVTCVSPLTIALFVDSSNENAILNPESENPEMVLNNWISFEGDSQLLNILSNLRTKINNLVNKKIAAPQKNLTIQDDNLIQLISTILTREDNSLGLIQPPGIGQRPKMLLITNYPAVNDVITENRYNTKQLNLNSGPDVLKFKPVQSTQYNQYLPHLANTELDCSPYTTSATNFTTQIPAGSQATALTQFPSNLPLTVPVEQSAHFEQFSTNSELFIKTGEYPEQFSAPPEECTNAISSYDTTSTQYTASNSQFLSGSHNIPNYDYQYMYNQTSHIQESSFLPFDSTCPTMNQVENYDVNYLNQNLFMMNLYNNPVTVEEDYYNNQCCGSQSSSLFDQDFDNNGVSVPDDQVEGACSLPPVDMSHQHLLTWMNTYCNEYTSYFIIKAGGMKSIDISISKKTWIFSPQTERRLLKLLQSGRIIILIFTVQGSNIFQGIARLLGGPVSNVVDNSQSNLACPIEWLSRADIPYTEVRHLFNPTCLDGMELSAEVGLKMCIMFTNRQPKPPQQNEPLTAPPSGRAILGGKRMI